MGIHNQVGHVKNPLTVIAIFASLSEVGGNVVLPFVEGPVQKTYVWFLMCFPFCLVLLFFVTLWCKHKVLYAPSDYRTDEAFLASLSPVSPKILRAKKADEIAEIVKILDGPSEKSDEPSTQSVAISDASLSASETPQDIRQAAMLAEDFVIARIGRDFGLVLTRNVVFKTSPNVAFDAVGVGGGRRVIVEVKYTSSGRMSEHAISKFFESLNSTYSSLPQDFQNNLEVFFAVVSQKPLGLDLVRLNRRIANIAKRYPFTTTTLFFDMESLTSNSDDDFALGTNAAESELANRIIGLLAAESMTHQEICRRLGVDSIDSVRVAQVQSVIGQLIASQTLGKDPSTPSSLKLVK